MKLLIKNGGGWAVVVEPLTVIEEYRAQWNRLKELRKSPLMAVKWRIRNGSKNS